MFDFLVFFRYTDPHDCAVIDGNLTIQFSATSGSGPGGRGPHIPVYEQVYVARRINGNLHLSGEMDPISQEFRARFPYLEHVNGTISLSASTYTHGKYTLTRVRMIAPLLSCVGGGGSTWNSTPLLPFVSTGPRRSSWKRRRP